MKMTIEIDTDTKTIKATMDGTVIDPSSLCVSKYERYDDMGDSVSISVCDDNKGTQTGMNWSFTDMSMDTGEASASAITSLAKNHDKFVKSQAIAEAVKAAMGDRGILDGLDDTGKKLAKELYKGAPGVN